MLQCCVLLGLQIHSTGVIFAASEANPWENVDIQQSIAKMNLSMFVKCILKVYSVPVGCGTGGKKSKIAGCVAAHVDP